MDTIDIKGDTELLDLLSSAPAAELGLLVDHLTDAGEGRMTLPAAIKELLLESRLRQLYTPTTLRILIRELQQFGGNTVANLARRSGVAYEEIVRDVSQHLGGKGEPSTPLEKVELAAVSARLAQLWPTLDESARQGYFTALNQQGVTSALSDLQTAVLAGGKVSAFIAQRLAESPYKPNHIAGTVKSVALGGALTRFLPAAVVAGANDLAGAAYRVTVPCVMHMAYLRQRRVAADAPSCPECAGALAGQARFCGNCGHDLRANGASMTAPASQSVAALPIATSHDGAELMIGSGGGLPMLSITSLVGLDASEQMQSLDLGAGAIDRLSPVLQALPSLVVGNEVAAHRYLKVVVNGPLAAAADGDGLRGFVRGPDGKFVEHGRFFEDDRLKNLVSGAAIFQIASIVVAQKHLADISRKLGEIQEGVARIEAFQRNERKSGINGTLQYLQQIGPVVLAGNLSSSIRDELEASERALSLIQDHILTDLNAITADVGTLKNTSAFSSGDLTKALKSRQSDFEELALQWKLCLATRFVACRLVCCYPGEQMLVERRQHVLNELTQVLLGPDGLLRQFPAAVAKRSSTLKALTDTQVEIQANQERLRLWEIDRVPAIESQGRATFEQLDRMLQENAQPVALVLEVQGDKIVRALAA